MRRSLRWRLSLAFSLLTFMAMVALATASLIATEEREEELIDEVVNATCNGILAQADLNRPLLLADHLRFFHAPLGVHPQGLPAEIVHFPVGNREWYGNGVEYHVGVREKDGERIYVLYDTALHEDRLFVLGVSLFVGILVLGAFLLLFGHWLSRHLLAQLSNLAERVRCDAAIEDPAQFDREVAILAEAIQTSRREKAELLEREREFTSHVSHEVRTPLTRIRTSAELIGEEGPTSLRRARQIMTAADDLETKLQGLLFLAREARIAPDRVDLRREVEAALHRIENLKPDLPRLNLIPANTSITADARLLGLLLDNLIGNAIRHTEVGQIGIDGNDTELTISDTGCGIAAEVLPRVFERHYRASTLPDGQGLGLAIVARICELSGWHYHIDSEVGVGTTVRIFFQPHKNLT